MLGSILETFPSQVLNKVECRGSHRLYCLLEESETLGTSVPYIYIEPVS
jgi:hypothetical protein